MSSPLRRSRTLPQARDTELTVADRTGGSLLMWKQGRVRLVARPGTEVRDVGTIRQIFNSVLLNDRGQALIEAILVDGRRVLVRIQ